MTNNILNFSRVEPQAPLGGAAKTLSDNGNRTTVEVDSVAREAEENSRRPEVGGTQRSINRKADILVVEDQDDLRRMVVRQLAARDFGVVDARSGDEAVDLLKSGCRPKLILTDVSMPGNVQGPELGHLARKMIGGVRIVLLSGYSRDAQAPVRGHDTGDVWLEKPVSRAGLNSAVDMAFDR